MEQKEIETLIEELESRVDRLRALYDQYFMGIEKMIPSVPHKDVERRFYVLRRTQIRNTALRFRFHNVLLKFNTYLTYWQRISRQIEEGTYKRDVRRANARFANPAVAAMVQARKRRDEKKEAGEGAAEEGDEELELEVDVDMASDAPTFEEEELARARAEVAAMRAKLRASKAPSKIPPGREEAPPSRPPGAPASEGGTIPPARSPGVSYAQKGPGRGKRISDLPPPLPIVGIEAEALRPRTRRPSRPAVEEEPPTSKRRSTNPPGPKAATPPPKAAGPAAKPAAAPLPRPRLPPPNPPPRPGSLSDERVRQIYTQYVETKRKTGESTAAITYDSLARSLRDSSEKLKEKHRGKSVDFEVAVKDGKAVLRPVVK